MLEKIKSTTDFINRRVDLVPEIGIVLGTGLGGLAREIDVHTTIPYEEIPNFPVSTVESHSGQLIFGKLSGKNVIAMQGRFHYYEGYSMHEIALPIRVMKLLGIKNLILSNASGGLNPEFEIGDLMVLNDHISLLPPENPLIGRNFNEFGVRFPDMSRPYDRGMIDKALETAKANKIRAHEGVYVSVTGPYLESPAEYKFLRIIGADTVGMSTVPEVITARHMQLPCFAVSIITDLGVPGKIKEVTVEEVIAVAMEAEPKMTLLMKEVIAHL